MPRVSRIFIDQACYHIIVRGNKKQRTFMENSDFLRYLSMLRRAKKRYGVRLYAYCLMANHVHLLIDTAHSRNISKFMHWLNRGYTAYFNAKYEIVGHLWQGRFISKPILKGYYLIHCATYIEMNPVRAKITDDIASYKWSSYKERCFFSDHNSIDEMKIEYSEEKCGTALISDLGTH